MTCYHPMPAHRDSSGRPVFHKRGSGAPTVFMLPCGQCIGCRYARSQKWALRCVHEAQLHDRNYFVTLTYADMPIDASLRLEDWQLFAKRVRYQIGSFRYYMCGEYGEENYRPHFHAAMFGLDLSDLRAFGFNDRGDPMYTSDSLERTWGHGMVGIGDVTFESAAYIARYCMKKATGKDLSRYSRVCPDSGECYQVAPEFSTMSRNPGIGASWFDRFMTDVFPSDEVVWNGRKYAVPRYYLERLSSLSALCSEDGGRASEDFVEALKVARESSAATHEEDLSEERLAVRERCVESKLHFFERAL